MKRSAPLAVADVVAEALADKADPDELAAALERGAELVRELEALRPIPDASEGRISPLAPGSAKGIMGHARPR